MIQLLACPPEHLLLESWITRKAVWLPWGHYFVRQVYRSSVSGLTDYPKRGPHQPPDVKMLPNDSCLPIPAILSVEFYQVRFRHCGTKTRYPLGLVLNFWPIEFMSIMKWWFYTVKFWNGLLHSHSNWNKGPSVMLLCHPRLLPSRHSEMFGQRVCIPAIWTKEIQSPEVARSLLLTSHQPELSQSMASSNSWKTGRCSIYSWWPRI